MGWDYLAAGAFGGSGVLIDSYLDILLDYISGVQFFYKGYALMISLD